jgi:ribonuclease VapC
MIVVDSSAVVAILFGEPSAPALLARLAVDPDRIMSVASYVETGTVLAGRRHADRLRAIDDLDAFLAEARIALAPVDVEQARLALWARIRFGRGMGHGGKLNFGDAFSYALPKRCQTGRCESCQTKSWAFCTSGAQPEINRTFTVFSR